MLVFLISLLPEGRIHVDVLWSATEPMIPWVTRHMFNYRTGTQLAHALKAWGWNAHLLNYSTREKKWHHVTDMWSHAGLRTRLNWGFPCLVIKHQGHKVSNPKSKARHISYCGRTQKRHAFRVATIMLVASLCKWVLRQMQAPPGLSRHCPQYLINNVHNIRSPCPIFSSTVQSVVACGIR